MLLIDLCTFCYRHFLPQMSGCVAHILSLSEPEGLISRNVNQTSLQGSRSITLAEKPKQLLVLGVLFIHWQKFALGLHQQSNCNTLGCIHGTCTNRYMSRSQQNCILQQSQTNRPPNFMYALLQLPKNGHLLLALIFYIVQNKYPLCTDMIPLAEIQIQRNTTRRI